MNQENDARRGAAPMKELQLEVWRSSNPGSWTSWRYFLECPCGAVEAGPVQHSADEAREAVVARAREGCHACGRTSGA